VRSGTRRAGLTAWAFLGPALAVYGFFALLPVLEALGLSLFSWSSSSSSASWLGLGNFAEVLGDGVFWRAVLNNVMLAALSVGIQLPVALVLAAILAGKVRGRWFFRTAYFAPMVVPTVVIAFFWRYFLLDYDKGLVNAALGLCGAGPVGWLGSAATAWPAVFSAISWRYIGFHMVILLAGVLAVPGELYEAAALDGAGVWGRFRHVTLPGVAPVLALSAMLSVVGSLKYFDLVYIMTGGKPDHTTELGATYIYDQGIAGGRWSYGCAMAVVLLGLSLAAAWAVLRVRRRVEVRA
jgi:raffinose/stachyose/melibiose transport system permease protein